MGLTSGTVDVWWASRDDAHEGLAALLDAQEQGRLQAYHRPADRERFLLGSAVVRLAAGAYLGRAPAQVRVDRHCPTCGAQHGKVRLLDAPDLQLSVSHSGDRVAVAFTARVPVGLDVEAVDVDVDPAEVGQLVLSPAERADIERLPGHAQLRALLRVWVRKEAIVKATGEGLRTTLTDLIVSGPEEVATVVRWPSHPHHAGRVRILDLEVDTDHVAALAVLTADEVTVRERSAAALWRAHEVSG